MALNLLRYHDQNQCAWGVLEHGQIYPLKIDESTTDTTAAVIRLGIQGIQQLVNREIALPLDAVELLSPITSEQKIICQGANYRQHMIDSGMNPDEKNFNMFFTKSSASIHAPVGAIAKPKHVQLLDYEIELCLILKQDIDHQVSVNGSNLHEYVAGICIGNDVSARDVQIPQTQFYKGKSYRSFCPLGPILCLLEAHEMHYLQQMNLSLKVNGAARQQDSSANMVFKPAETLSEMSQVFNFRAGDVVMTGTPSGCALSIPSPLLVKISGLLPEHKKWEIFIKKQKATGCYLNIGDVLELQIQSADGKIDLGTQRHTVEFLK